MNKFWILLILAAIPLFSCLNQTRSFVRVGDLNSSQNWVYLSGLTDDFYSEQETQNRQILDKIGKKLKITFLAMIPKHRSPEFGNKLCWPHNCKEEVSKTFYEIETSLNRSKIVGYIGFSNGGFFLNRLIQFKKVEVPIISIGAAGFLESDEFGGNLYLVVGRHDVAHYDLVKKLYAQALDSKIKATLVEFEGWHEINEQALLNVFRNITQTHEY